MRDEHCVSATITKDPSRHQTASRDTQEKPKWKAHSQQTHQEIPRTRGQLTCNKLFFIFNQKQVRVTWRVPSTDPCRVAVWTTKCRAPVCGFRSALIRGSAELRESAIPFRLAVVLGAFFCRPPLVGSRVCTRIGHRSIFRCIRSLRGSEAFILWNIQMKVGSQKQFIVTRSKVSVLTTIKSTNPIRVPSLNSKHALFLIRLIYMSPKTLRHSLFIIVSSNHSLACSLAKFKNSGLVRNIH